jgi:hypothetical protein
MNGSLRNRQGCWTCRLRKKKCDESRPQCSNCQSLSIPCYGFGPKPDWIGDGEKEREIIDSIKETVKRTSRRKAPVRLSDQQASVVRIQPKSSEIATDKSDSGSELSQKNEISVQLRSLVR